MHGINGFKNAVYDPFQCVQNEDNKSFHFRDLPNANVENSAWSPIRINRWACLNHGCCNSNEDRQTDRQSLSNVSSLRTHNLRVGLCYTYVS